MLILWFFLLFDTVLQYICFKYSIHLSCQVLNHVWFMFDILSKWILEDIVGIKFYGQIINFLFLYIISTENLLFVFIFRRMQF